MKDLKIMACPFNGVVGDFQGNLNKIKGYITQAHLEGADLVVFPELAMLGGDPKDLAFNSSYMERANQALKDLVESCPVGLGVIIGGLVSVEGLVLETLFFIADGGLTHTHSTVYGLESSPFDQKYFYKNTFRFKGKKILMCFGHELDDSNFNLWSRAQRKKKPDLVVCVEDHGFANEDHFDACWPSLTDSHLLTVNGYGLRGTEFSDGTIMIARPNHEPRVISSLVEGLCVVDFDKSPALGNGPEDMFYGLDLIYRVIYSAIKDFVVKNGFERVHLGLSGGIDSALVATLAVKALGADNVIGILMPSQYSSGHSITDAEDLAKRLGIKTLMIPIAGAYEEFSSGCGSQFGVEGLTAENLQARIRAVYLMAYSNANRSLLLTTGNKSEVACGYGTLYGDMCGSFNPIGDLYKTEVYALSRFINTEEPSQPIPQNTIDKSPSAELSPGQTDQDSLPPYKILDLFIEGILMGSSVEELLDVGLAPEEARRIYGLITSQHFKRIQAAPILQLSNTCFGDVDMPLFNKFNPL